MMLTQFHDRYPTGSLISELLTIHQGKFVVRVAIQIDGVSRASGMAAADTVEEAEDKARNRAIAAIAQEAAPSSPIAAVPIQPPPAEIRIPLTGQNVNPNPAWSATVPAPDLYEAAPSVSITPSPDEAPLYPPPAKEIEFAPINTVGQGNSKGSSLISNPPEPEEEVFGEYGLTQTQTESISTPTKPPSYQPQFSLEPEFDANMPEPIDLSDELIAIGILLNELRWKPNQESECLQSNYGKSSRDELTPEQVQEFRRYLELFSETTKVLKELKWTGQKGREFLAQTYNKEFRYQLSYQQLQEFLHYLQSERERR